MSLLPTPPTTLTITTTNTSTSIARPAVILPGLGNNSGDYKELSLCLKEYGVSSVVAKVSRLDWFRKAGILLDSNFWKGTLKPRPVLDWYLERVYGAVCEAKQLSPDGGGISLIGHSAGGWLARLYLEEFGHSDIALLLTLGSPHLPPPKGVPGVIDQTRGMLDYVQKHCPPAVYTREIKYVCVAGRFIHGACLGRKSSLLLGNNNGHCQSVVANGKTPLSARFVGQGYKQVCGKAEVWGDGVVPEESAYLEGALNISLDGVYHSPFGSDETRPWYGSPSVLDKWVHHLLN